MEFYAVIDTNVIVSSILSKKEESATKRIVDFVKDGTIIPMYNEEILAEYEAVLKRDKFQFAPGIADNLIEVFKSSGMDCDRKKTNYLLPDPDDIVFYEVSLSREDAYLVTGNLKHFPKNGKVVSPADMVQIIALAKCPKDVLCEDPGPKYQSDEKREILERGWAAIEKIRANAVLNGTADMPLEEINEEIRLARLERREREAREQAAKQE